MQTSKNDTIYWVKPTFTSLINRLNCSKFFIWHLLMLVFILLPTQFISAQIESDSIFLKDANIAVEIDTSKIDILHSPKKAGWLSVLPGLGQAYNKKYWKIPIIYAALLTNTYFLVKNNQEYIKYRDAYIMRIDEDPETIDDFPNYTTENLRVLKNQYWKYRDLNLIIMAGIYTLNILDAVVDAHFYTYDIGDDLSLRITPVVVPSLGFGSRHSAYTGLSFSLSF